MERVVAAEPAGTAGADLRSHEGLTIPLLSDLPLMLYRCRNDKRLTMEFVSEGCRSLTGYEPADFMLRDKLTYAELIHPEDVACVRGEIESALLKKEPFQLTYRIRTAGGEERGVLEMGQGVFSPVTDDPVAFEGVVMDITAVKSDEQRLKDQAALIEMSPDAVIVLDMNQNIVFWNAGAENLYGWTREEVMGKNAHKEISPQPLEVRRIVIEEGEWSGELPQVTKDGRAIVVESRWALVRDCDGKPKSMLIINTDITDRKKLESQFLRAQRLESIGNLASGIAHDLNNVLQPMMLSLHLLRSSPKDETSNNVIDILQTNANRGANLVNQVLSYASGLEYQKVVLRIPQLVSSLEKMLLETFPKSIQMEVGVPADTWMVSGDPTQIDQVFMNLCLNARDAMPSGGKLTITAENVYVDEKYARINIDAEPGRYTVITVSDTGCGIPESIMDRVFDPYFSTKDPDKGSGLGLATAYGIVKKHGGFINIYSEVDKGTTFRVYLPAAEDIQEDYQAEENEEVPRGNGELVLLVDDEDSIRHITKITLENSGYTVITAPDGPDALALYAVERERVKVVIMDMMMPIMDGPTTVRSLRRIDPGVKVIGMSGLRDNEKLVGSGENGIQAFLAKPYTSEVLLRMINRVLKQ